jgi:Caspase domain
MLLFLTNSLQISVRALRAVKLSLVLGLCLSASFAEPFVRYSLAQQTTDRNLVVQVAPVLGTKKDQKLALIFGNGAYKDAPLANPVNDARAIAQTLTTLGFSVILKENADLRTMQAAVRDFGDKLAAGGVGLFYYAGHGMQIKGSNYLIPVGSNIEREDEVAYGAMDAQTVLDKMDSAGNGMNFMILDACRNNPFVRATRNGKAGLSQMDAPVGTLVSFATSPGAVASDGSGTNGLYTTHLLEALRQPGLTAESVFKRVRANVRRDSSGAQVPWEATSLEGDFFFLHSADSEKQTQLQQLQLAAVGSSAQQKKTVAPPVQTNPFGFSTGDTWRFQVVDRFKGEIVRTESTTVESVESNGNWVAKDKRIFSPQGQTIISPKTDTVWKYVGQHYWRPPTFEIGSSTPYKHKIENSKDTTLISSAEIEGVFKVIRNEKISTPAGEFDAIRVERRQMHNWSSGNRGFYRMEGWYVPKLRNYVRIDEEVQRIDNSFEFKERRELLSYKVAIETSAATTLKQ